MSTLAAVDRPDDACVLTVALVFRRRRPRAGRPAADGRALYILPSILLFIFGRKAVNRSSSPAGQRLGASSARYRHKDQS
jgi:hypothetical protein